MVGNLGKCLAFDLRKCAHERGDDLVFLRASGLAR